jgi:hypothetical protein
MWDSAAAIATTLATAKFRRAAGDGSEAALFGSIAILRSVSVEETLSTILESSDLAQGADGQKWSMRARPRTRACAATNAD